MMVVISELCSSSSSTPSYTYDVFLSFSGFDTRFSFTDHLYHALVNANITTFLDDEEVEIGLSLKPELESAIKASRASIIVLSPNYAFSTWCLNELALILEQHRNFDHIVLPIFYHVEPTDIRKQQSSFGEAMAKHKWRMEKEANGEKKSQWAQKIDMWKKALMEVSDLKGEVAKGRKETELIGKIVTNIHRKLGVSLSITLPSLIGMYDDINFITSWLKDGSSHIADILTIWGLSGIGKTSLAEYVFKLYGHEFQRSSFIVDVSRKCAEKSSGLLDLQKQICHDISKIGSIQGHHVSAYTSQIENALARTKVFLVLDDVDSHDHLDALLGKKGFHQGSKIIITTKDVSLTEKCELFNQIVQPKHTKHLLQGLNDYDSLTLLSLCAFKCNNPTEGYREVSKKLVKYCKGHPLALEVIGKSLRTGDVAEWEDYLQRLKEEPDSRIRKVLQMSFDSLPSTHDKELFMDIACFFVGKDKKSVETVLKACGVRIVLGIKNLVERCLLSIGNDNKLMMHQLVQEMGRDIVRQESPKRPEKRSRLWCHEESFQVLKQKKGKGNVLGLALDMRMLEKDKLYELETDALSKMHNLKLLQLNHVQLKGSYKNFPEELRWLCMQGFRLDYIPPCLQLENLVDLDMSYSKLVSFDMSIGDPKRSRKRQKLTGMGSKDKPLLKSLKFLNLSYCEQLNSVGSFSDFPKLERLILSNCKSLIAICESIEQCYALDLIDLSYCNEAGKLLRTIAKLRNVKTLNLDGCNLSQFPIKMSYVELPKMFEVNNIVISAQTSSSNIMDIIPRDFRSHGIYLPSSLVWLSLKDNQLSNESFPMDMSSLCMLKELCLDGNCIVSMPSCVRTLPRLEKLSINQCRRLTTIEHPPRTLKELILGIYMKGKVVFDREMSPIKLMGNCGSFIEGIFEEKDMENVEEKLLHSLGWSNLDFTKVQPASKRYKVQMQYEFGIFSTFYVGKEIPNWISGRSKEPSISFTIPSSPNKLSGLNICFMLMLPNESMFVFVDIKISNITKNRTWIYNRSWIFVSSREGLIIYLSHWMFGKNEMEDGDQLTISISKTSGSHISIRECGVSIVYDEDEKMEEEKDALGYYKSWNHIIGGDLSPFQTTTPGQYKLSRDRFLGYPYGSGYIDTNNWILGSGNRRCRSTRRRTFEETDGVKAAGGDGDAGGNGRRQRQWRLWFVANEEQPGDRQMEPGRFPLNISVLLQSKTCSKHERSIGYEEER
ncbi:hypothetical protein OSB04_013276 [Centaurea solstitialis]|uniref:TIR domain-containing protein n=1 Tax=Centaurea solstitialis TaxID=347529 RepID=A0AA38WFC4_9ASTR|nr:hypothetical protein OSB04_013276 [Centaurea solstitialis]